MLISIISIICYVTAEIFLVKRSILNFYLFIITNLLVIIQLFLNNTFFQDYNLVFTNLFSLIMCIIGIYNWKRIKNKGET
jgi:nicotinamide riboside transporter PnuC